MHVLYGSAHGLDAAGSQLWEEGSGGRADQPDTDDWFGRSLATGDFNHDGFADLAIGVLHQSVNGHEQAGAVHILYGSTGGLTTAGNSRWYEGTERRVHAQLTDVQREEASGVGAGTLFQQTPPGESVSNHIASVTKVMTL